MDMSGVPGLFRGAGDLHDALVEIDLPDRRDTIGGGTVPTLSDRLGEIAVFISIKGVVKDERATLEPDFVISEGRARSGD